MLLPLALCAVAGVPAVHAHGSAAVVSADMQITKRMRPNSPSSGYAPAIVDCPSARPTIRSAAALSDSETQWLSSRRTATVKPMTDLLQRAAIPDFDAVSYINGIASNFSALPNIAIAISGGGYRALTNGAGFVAAADSRTTGAIGKGGIGGLLQASTYLAGLSGGGWLVGSLYANNFTSVEALRNGSPGSSVWQFQDSIFEDPASSGISLFNTASYWADVVEQVDSKKNAGFNVSITDFWGRMLSYQLINATDGGPAYTFSSVAQDSDFSQAQAPFPILIADGRAPNEKIVSLNATVFEFNPFEMGSWDPTVFAFAPNEYLGSNFSAGVVPSNGQCVSGFDQAGFVMGTSSTLFNALVTENISSFGNIPSVAVQALEGILQGLGESNNDIAQYMPNPFLGYNNDTNPSASAIELDLVDGGEDLQNIPLHPLIQPSRNIDVIFAVDSSADTDFNWPNATALRATYDRASTPIANGTLFPPVPDANTFINLGLNSRPTFFGCNASNFTLGPGQHVPPLVVYIPNAPYTAMSNISTLTLSYTERQRNDNIRNGFDAATQGNGTIDAEWTECVACAILSRSLHKISMAVPATCVSCFQRYCWNGTVDTVDRGRYEPSFKIGNGTSTPISASSTLSSSAPSVFLALIFSSAAVSLIWIS
jgi:lysophospholipase